MAIRTIKEIIDTKGYTIDSRDRNIFQEGDLQSFFGLSDNDIIEFIVYDANDNQLPQSGYGLVRYIQLNTANIKDYFLISDGIKLTRNELPTEYFIDVERLLREGGYNNGIFKVQITLLNKRVGSENGNEQLRISQISPSRTEIRVVPITKSGTSPQFLERYSILQTSDTFREDTQVLINSYLEQLNPINVYDTLVAEYGIEWLNLVRKDFKINNLETLLNDIYTKFSEAANYEFTNRISDITDVNYGNPKEENISLNLSVKSITQKCNDILIQCINEFLPQQDVQSELKSKTTKSSSVDDIKRILQQRVNDVVKTTEIERVVMSETSTNIIAEKIPNKIDTPNNVPTERLINYE